MGASVEDLLDVYILQIRCVLEYAVPVWQGCISQIEKEDIERVQKTACRIILSSFAITYEQALCTLKLDTLEDRINKLTLKFALKAEKTPKIYKLVCKEKLPYEHKESNSEIPPSICKPQQICKQSLGLLD